MKSLEEALRDVVDRRSWQGRCYQLTRCADLRLYGDAVWLSQPAGAPSNGSATQRHDYECLAGFTAIAEALRTYAR